MRPGRADGEATVCTLVGSGEVKGGSATSVAPGSPPHELAIVSNTIIGMMTSPEHLLRTECIDSLPFTWNLWKLNNTNRTSAHAWPGGPVKLLRRSILGVEGVVDLHIVSPQGTGKVGDAHQDTISGGHLNDTTAVEVASQEIAARVA